MEDFTTGPDYYRTEHEKPISFLPLVMLIFYGVSGGPFGNEQMVKYGGPLLSILGFIVLPIAWSIPEALITAELSTAFPEASGFVAWVSTAFGPFWGFQEGYISWLSGVTDNALYPILFLDYLAQMFDDGFIFGGGFLRWAFIITFSIFLTYLNYRGLDVVGNTAIIVCFLSLIPFVPFVILGFIQANPSQWGELPEGGWDAVKWSKFLNIMFWNLNYWDSAASFAGDVRNPGKTFPRAMLWAVVMVVLVGVLPIMAATGSDKDNWKKWDDGYFETLGESIGGGLWLGIWIVFAAAVSNVGLFEAEMSSDSLQVAGMAERGMLPLRLAARSKHGTPTYGILLSATGVICLGWLSFTEIVEMLNVLYCVAQILEFAAFLYLRFRYPTLPRPYKIPLGNVGLVLMLLLPTALLLVILVLSSWLSKIVAFGAVLSGIGLWYLLERAKREQWWHFEDIFAQQTADAEAAAAAAMQAEAEAEAAERADAHGMATPSSSSSSSSSSSASDEDSHSTDAMLPSSTKRMKEVTAPLFARRSRQGTMDSEADAGNTSVVPQDLDEGELGIVREGTRNSSSNSYDGGGGDADTDAAISGTQSLLS